MKQVVINFRNPFTRAQVRAAFASLVVPAGAIISGTTVGREDELAETPDAENDLVVQVRVRGFTTFAEFADFLNSIPAAADDRITDIYYG